VPRDAKTQPAVGWYRDPSGRFEFRFWDGNQWRAEVTANGSHHFDPPTWPAPSERQGSTQSASPGSDLEPESPRPFASAQLTSSRTAKPAAAGPGAEHRPPTRLTKQAVIVGAVSFSAGVAMVAAEQLAAGAAALIFVLATLVGGWAVANGLVLWLKSRGPRQPRTPKLGTAKRPRIPREPKKQVPQLSSKCVICGRPLTNTQSMRARVGTTCIKTYGPRYAWVVNPEHIAWRKLLESAEATRAAEQTRLNAVHAEATRAYPLALQAWEAERLTPLGQSRAARRLVARHRLILGGVVAPVGTFVGLAAALPVI
jgi:hypothetical protein